MEKLIYKYNLKEACFDDNLTIQDFDTETFNYGTMAHVYSTLSYYSRLLRGEVIQKNNALYSLSKDAIEEKLKNIIANRLFNHIDEWEKQNK